MSGVAVFHNQFPVTEKIDPLSTSTISHIQYPIHREACALLAHALTHLINSLHSTRVVIGIFHTSPQFGAATFLCRFENLCPVLSVCDLNRMVRSNINNTDCVYGVCRCAVVAVVVIYAQFIVVFLDRQTNKSHTPILYDIAREW